MSSQPEPGSPARPRISPRRASNNVTAPAFPDVRPSTRSLGAVGGPQYATTMFRRRFGAGDEFDQFRAVEFGDWAVMDQVPISQDAGSVRDREQFVDVVGDEQHAVTGVGEVSQGVEQALAIVRRKRCRGSSRVHMPRCHSTPRGLSAIATNDCSARVSDDNGGEGRAPSRSPHLDSRGVDNVGAVDRPSRACPSRTR